MIIGEFNSEKSAQRHSIMQHDGMVTANCGQGDGYICWKSFGCK